jgi:transcription initiation factor TFIIA large subunit
MDTRHLRPTPGFPIPQTQRIQRVLPTNVPQVSHLQHQPHVQQTSVIQQNFQHRQHDGPVDDPSESDSDDSGSDESVVESANPANPGEDEESLNSADDVSGTDGTEIFETENVVVCQFDKIQRVRNKWRFHLKDGIMSLNGKDFVFQKATGDGEW